MLRLHTQFNLALKQSRLLVVYTRSFTRPPRPILSQYNESIYLIAHSSQGYIPGMASSTLFPLMLMKRNTKITSYTERVWRNRFQKRYYGQSIIDGSINFMLWYWPYSSPSTLPPSQWYEFFTDSIFWMCWMLSVKSSTRYLRSSLLVA